MRAYFIDRGEDETRREVVIPDTAHGTNPASVAMAGYTLVHVRTDARGNIERGTCARWSAPTPRG